MQPDQRTDAELRASEARLSALVRASSDAVYTVSPDWHELRYLHGQNFIADVSEPTVNWMDRYVLAEDLPRVRAAIEAAIASRSVFELEHRVIRVDGSTGWTFSRAVPLIGPDGAITQWMGMASDITARKQAEQALAESNARMERQRRLYEAILTNTPDFAYVWNREHRFIYVNEGLLKAWGRTRAEAIGRNCLELGYEPWHAALHDREIDSIFATGQPVRGEVPFTGTLGRRIYDYILVPVFGPDGAVEAVAGTTRDVTELREADQRKDEFIATLAHELRNPLAPLRTGLEILRLRGPDAVASVLGIMQRQVNHLVRLVDDLLEISRITTGALELRRERLDLRTILQNAVETSDPLIRAGGHELEIAAPPDALWFNGDAVRLSQVVANLLNNAARYTPQHGRIELALRRDGDLALISVRDNGIGIAPENLARVFEMFGRFSATAHGQGESGLGIGLTLAQRLAEMHGGTLTVHSAGPGEGSEFTLCLPLERTAEPAAASGTVEAPGTQAPPRILVVDDNHDAAETLAVILRLLGAEVQVAHDGATALRLFADLDPQVVLLDIGMPGMDGFEVAQRLRERPLPPGLKLVALTGWGQDEDRRRTREAGFTHHLVKPVDVDELQKILF